MFKFSKNNFLTAFPFLFIFQICLSQTAFKNYGDIKIHNEAEVGFHSDVINDGNFENNDGFTGFYSDNESITISGENNVGFNNVEVDVINNLNLETSMEINNQLEFVNGKIKTPRQDANISLNFINPEFYVGEDDERYVESYTSIIGKSDFTFPIGDDNRIRPMSILNNLEQDQFKGAYFYEDPNTAYALSNEYSTEQKQEQLVSISTYEYWFLNGKTEANVTLTWDNFSTIESLSSDISTLRVVGWSKSTQMWIDLGAIDIQGDLYEGTITSNLFVPSEFAIITIGAVDINANLEESNNYLISPNEDGTNDTLHFNEVELFSDNELVIFNRWGNEVLKKTNYKNDWAGISEGRSTVAEDNKLPAGTYFYTLKYGNSELNNSKSGWVYINY